MKNSIIIAILGFFWALNAGGQNFPGSELFPPQNLQAIVNGINVQLTWNPPDSAAGITGYHVYKNGFKITYTPLTALSYTDIGLNQGTYTYQVSSVYDTVESVLSAPVQAVIASFVTVGTGTTAVGWPYYTFYMGSRTQMLYTAADLIAGGAVTGPLNSVGFNIVSASTQTMTNFTIKMGHTLNATLTGWVTSGMSTVYQVNYSVPGTGWRDIALTAPFIWNGTSNVVVEICFGNNGSYTSNSTVMGTAVAGRTWHYHLDNYAGCTGVAAGGVQSTTPNIRFGVPPVNGGTITGTVRDANTNLPVPNAIVQIGNQADISDNAGQYVLFGIAPGVATILTSHDSYPAFTDTATIVSNGVTNKDILIPPGPRLGGMVTNAATGTPVEGATITVANVSALSLADGSYLTPSMNVVGAQTVVISGQGYEIYIGAVTLFADSTTNFDAALLPITYPPGLFTATLNDPVFPVAVNLVWDAPTGFLKTPGNGPSNVSGEQMVPGDIDYQVWRLQQGEEDNENLWTSLGVVDTTDTVDDHWPVLPDGPYRWAVKAIYGPGQRFSDPSFSNAIGKNWTTVIDVCVTLSCLVDALEGTVVTLTNLEFPDSSYVATTDATGCVHFPEVWKGNYQLMATHFLYVTDTQNISAFDFQEIDVSLNEDLIPVTNLAVIESSLLATWSPPKTTYLQLDEPFTDFTTNQWEISGGTNWQLSSVSGNPAPCAMFNWSPQVSNYDQFLTSKSLAGLNAQSQRLKYDIYLINNGFTYVNAMAVELWDGVNWNVLRTYLSTDGSFIWTSENIDISSATGLPSFRIRFHASGEDSFDLNSWNIDNVQVESSDGSGNTNPCVVGYNFYLNGGFTATTTDSLYQIAPALVQYGQTYNACVEAVYQNGPSPQVCFQFASHYLYPPRTLAGTSSINSTYLTWTTPVTTAGIIGYNIYRNDQKLNTGLVPTLYYIDNGVPTGMYSYEVTAVYDLSYYGSPGQMGESGPAGPVLINITGMPFAPVTTAGSVGTPYNATSLVPITVSGFTDISAFTLRLEYDPAILTFTGTANIAPELTGLTATSSVVSPTLNKITIDWSNAIPQSLLPNGKMVDLRFDYSSGNSGIHLNNEANGGADCSYFDSQSNPMPDIPDSLFYFDGDVHWEQGYMISGNYNYNNSGNTPLDNLKVMLKNGESKIDSVLTDALGHFDFQNIINGSYQLKAYSTKEWEGVNSTDALKIQRHFVGFEVITEPVRKLAADVNNTNVINSTDALKVKRRFIGLDSGFPRGDWAFVKPIVGGDTIVVNNSDVVQDFYGLCVGDVNASNIPDPGKSTIPTVTLQHDGMMEINSGKEVEIPVFIKTTTEIGAISMVLKIPPSTLNIINVEVLHGEVMFEEAGNQIRIAWSEINPLKVNPDEAFMKIKVKVNENIPAGEVITFTLANNSEISDGLGLPVFPATLSIPLMKVSGAGVGTDEILSGVALFPNPANEWISISYVLGEPAKVLMEICNPYGQILDIKHVAQTLAGSYEQNFDVSGFSSGLYFIRIKATLRQEEYVKTMRMVISK